MKKMNLLFELTYINIYKSIFYNKLIFKLSNLKLMLNPTVIETD